MASDDNGSASGRGGHGSGIDPKNVPASLKSIKPYVSRGSELENMALRAPGKMDYQRRAAYYCYLHALQTGLEKMKGLEKGPQAQEAENYLLSVMDALEKEKETLNISEDDKQDDAELVKSNALKAFKNADNQLRDGKADNKTARGFYIASNFFDILGGMECSSVIPNFEEMKKYAKYYALHINECIRSGTRPTLPNDEEGIETDDVNMDKKRNDSEDKEVDLSVETRGDASAPPPPEEDEHMPSPPTSSAHAYQPAKSESQYRESHYNAENGVSGNAGSYRSQAENEGQQPSFFSSLLKKREEQPVLATEESAVLSTTVNFHEDGLHDAWELARFGLRAMETGDKKSAREYLEKSLGYL